MGLSEFQHWCSMNIRFFNEQCPSLLQIIGNIQEGEFEKFGTFLCYGIYILMSRCLNLSSHKISEKSRRGTWVYVGDSDEQPLGGVNIKNDEIPLVGFLLSCLLTM